MPALAVLAFQALQAWLKTSGHQIRHGLNEQGMGVQDAPDTMRPSPHMPERACHRGRPGNVSAHEQMRLPGWSGASRTPCA